MPVLERSYDFKAQGRERAEHGAQDFDLAKQMIGSVRIAYVSFI